MKRDILIVVLFLLSVFCYPVDGKSWISASDVKFRTGDTLQDYRDESYYTTTFVPTASPYVYKLNTKGLKSLVSFYVKRTNEAVNVQKYIFDNGYIGNYLNYTFHSGAGDAITITPSATADPKIWDMTITGATNQVVFLERQIIK